MLSRQLSSQLPDSLRVLVRLACNFWWTWNNNGIALFRDIDPEHWDACAHSPLRLLREVSAERLWQLAADPDYLERLAQVMRRFDAYLEPSPAGSQQDNPGQPGSRGGAPGGPGEVWARRFLPHADPARPVAYFCAEYGIHESLPLYSGGLGMLAGDHLKSASDLGVPLIAIGLLYRQGYFRQRINLQSWQEEFYQDANFGEMPLTPIKRPDGTPLLIPVPVRDRTVQAKLWRTDIGRVPIYLLDTDHDANDSIDRWITAHLYGGDANTRVLQEVVLGIGGVRTLRALDVNPSVYHLNEGHSAFLTLELARELVATGQTFENACREVRKHCVFTTHTPVPAGNDVFESSTLREVLIQFLPELGADSATILGLGRRHPEDELEPFGMTPLAIRMSRSTNGVSKRHGEVCARMWHQLAHEPGHEGTPIVSVTNGVHHSTWVAPLMRRLYDSYLGLDWELRADEPEIWKLLDGIPDAELWRVHCILKGRLVSVVRHRASIQWRNAGEPESVVAMASELLSPEILTIGFARRVAGYKRWSLLLHDPDRALALLDHPTRPVQLVLAGKAHPRDNEAKRILQQLLQAGRGARARRRAVFLEDYDQYVARKLVQGVDVWLNLPLPPLEASGTSGQKVVVNGGINLSVLDGWWAEGSNGENGWDVGTPYVLPPAGDKLTPPESRNEADAESVFDQIENQIRPMFYERDADGIPRRWVARMRASIKSLTPTFSATRMVKEYCRIYWPG